MICCHCRKDKSIHLFPPSAVSARSKLCRECTHNRRVNSYQRIIPEISPQEAKRVGVKRWDWRERQEEGKRQIRAIIRNQDNARLIELRKQRLTAMQPNKFATEAVQ